MLIAAPLSFPYCVKRQKSLLEPAPVVLPLVDYAAVSVPHSVVFQVQATVDINYTARAVTPSAQIPMFIVGSRHVAPLIYGSTVGRMAPSPPHPDPNPSQYRC